jgi:hypothetical protein
MRICFAIFEGIEIKELEVVWWLEIIERVLMPCLKRVKKESHVEKYGEYENNGHDTKTSLNSMLELRFSG